MLKLTIFILYLLRVMPASRLIKTERCHPEALNGESVQIIADVQDLKSSERIKKAPGKKYPMIKQIRTTGKMLNIHT